MVESCSSVDELAKSGDSTTLRFLFAKIDVDEGYGDVTTARN